MKAKTKPKPLTTSQQAMLERLKEFSAKKPFVPFGLGEDSTIQSLYRRGLLDSRLVQTSRVQVAPSQWNTAFRAGYWLRK